MTASATELRGLTANRRRERRRTLRGLGFLAPWLLGFVIFTAYPLAATVFFGFTDFSLFDAPNWVGWDNYAKLLTDQTFLLSVRNTLVFTVIAVPLSIAIALALALLLNNRARGRAVYRTIVFAPSVLPAAAVAAVWTWILSPQFGLLNGLLRLVGLPTPPWLSDPDWAIASVAIMTLWMIGSDMLLYLAALQDVPPEQYEAAALDGAGPWRRLWSITIPNLTPVIFFQLINALIWAFQYFSIPYIVGQQGQGKPGGSLTFYSIYLYQNAFSDLRMGYASAMATVMFVVVLALTIVIVRTSRRWVSYDR